jgi:hypothetical protein
MAVPLALAGKAASAAGGFALNHIELLLGVAAGGAVGYQIGKRAGSAALPPRELVIHTQKGVLSKLSKPERIAVALQMLMAEGLTIRGVLGLPLTGNDFYAHYNGDDDAVSDAFDITEKEGHNVGW